MVYALGYHTDRIGSLSNAGQDLSDITTAIYCFHLRDGAGRLIARHVLGRRLDLDRRLEIKDNQGTISVASVSSMP